jgi:hypothetical protein
VPKSSLTKPMSVVLIADLLGGPRRPANFPILD